MNTVAAESRTALRPRSPSTPRAPRDAWLYLALLALIGSAWALGRSGWYRSGDDASYWIAVVGGSMMLVLMLYPVRKYVRGLQNLGRLRSWFWMHLICGLAGPWLVLVHSTFRIGSINAGVALVSMCIVVASGVVGRYLYVRVNLGLNGERTTLRELRERAGLVESDARSKLAFAPEVEARLLDFEQRETASRPTLATALRQVLWLPAQVWRERRVCHRLLRVRLAEMAGQGGWSDEDHRRRQRLARKLVAQYLEAVLRVAQFGATERVFALWHVAHMPFVVLLVVSAVVHVVAVHAY